MAELLAPQSAKAAANPNHTQDESIASGAWDVATWADPFFITDIIEWTVRTDWLHSSCPSGGVATPGAINWLNTSAVNSPLFQ